METWLIDALRHQEMLEKSRAGKTLNWWRNKPGKRRKKKINQSFIIKSE